MDARTLIHLKLIRRVLCSLLFILIVSGTDADARDFLTDKEIELIQDAQAVDNRTRIYMEAAALRLKTVQDRLNGKESAPGDPMEFFSVEDMLDDYCRIFRSVILIADDAFQNRRRKENANISKALKTLKSESAKRMKELEALKPIAEEKQGKEFIKRVNQAIEITEEAFEGAQEGLSLL